MKIILALQLYSLLVWTSEAKTCSYQEDVDRRNFQCTLDEYCAGKDHEISCTGDVNGEHRIVQTFEYCDERTAVCLEHTEDQSNEQFETVRMEDTVQLTNGNQLKYESVLNFLDSNTASCEAYLNGNKCDACAFATCANGDPGRAEDCTNIDPSWSFKLCNGDNVFEFLARADRLDIADGSDSSSSLPLFQLWNGIQGVLAVALVRFLTSSARGI